MLLIETLFIVQIFIFVFFPSVIEQDKLVEGINNCDSEIKFEKVVINNDSEWDAALQEVYDIIRTRSDCLFEPSDFEKIIRLTVSHDERSPLSQSLSRILVF